ncbi:MAG: hypothetical protein WCA49_22430 [Candidatus Sulfotelmatobacter sp.]
MQRSFSRKCGVSAVLIFGLALVSPDGLLATSNGRVITFSGQEIPSIFEGLKPNRFLLEYVPDRSKARKERWRLEEGKLDTHLGARYILAQCAACPSDTPCADHYQVLEDSSGCIDPLGACQLPLHNATTNTKTGVYSQGAYDSYCGEYCCEDAQECDNP